MESRFIPREVSNTYDLIRMFYVTACTTVLPWEHRLCELRGSGMLMKSGFSLKLTLDESAHLDNSNNSRISAL